MRGNDESLAARAARALWLVDKQEAALSRLYELLEEGDSKTRSDCCMYLAETGRSSRTVSALRKALRDPDQDVRRWARGGLKRLGAD
jgi:HEAT repeat protein